MSNLEQISHKIFTLFVAAILFTGSFAANPLSLPGAYAENLTDENGFPKPIESFHFDSSNTHSLDLISDAVIIDEDNPYLLLDGNSDYAKVSLPNYDSYLDEFTISAWVKPDYSNGSPEFTIASMENSFQLVINKLIEPEKYAKFSVYDGIKWYTVTSVVSIEEEWTHITATFADSTIRIYVNGKFAATVSDVPMPILPFVTSDDSKITVGAFDPFRSDVSKTKNYFSGSIDAIQIFPLSLDSTQIEELFAKERLSDASQLVEKILDTVNASLDIITTDQTTNEFGFVAIDEQNDAQEIEEQASKGFKVAKEEKKKKGPILTVITKVINYDGGSATASDFRMSVDGNDPKPESFPGDEKGVQVLLRAGSYDVSEYGPVGYTPSFSADCAGTIKLGEKRSCTVTNYDGQEFGASTVVITSTDTSTGSSDTTTGYTTTGSSDVPPFDDGTIVIPSSDTSTESSGTTTDDTSSFFASSSVYEEDQSDDKFLKKYIKLLKNTIKASSDLPDSSTYGLWTNTKHRLYGIVDGKLVDYTDDPRINFRLIDVDGDNKNDKAVWDVPADVTEFYIVAEITVINVQSYPIVGGTWEVQFDTVGQADLIISVISGTTWDNVDQEIVGEAELEELKKSLAENIESYEELRETTKTIDLISLTKLIIKQMEEIQELELLVSENSNFVALGDKDLTFLELRCGEQVIPYQWIDNSVVVENYTCNEEATEVSKVLTAGKHSLEFRFGNDIGYAFNNADVLEIGLIKESDPLDASVGETVQYTIKVINLPA
ncbi:MAG: hypothetical protein O6761_03490, partial [Thaumarchaeota archaeon]|nr:hypothetical protein [Nitrososphaerota archaeon]